MANPRDYMPGRESELVAWTRTLAGQLLLAPAEYGTTAEAAEAYQAIQSAFEEAWDVTQKPTTRTTPAITAKNDAKAALIAATRPLVQRLQNYAGMTNGKRETLGIPVRDRGPTPIHPPASFPRLSVASVEGRLIGLRLKNAEGTTGKPRGARAAYLYRFTGETPPDDLSGFTFAGATTNLRPQLVMPEGTPAGTKVWITSCWVSPTEKLGPACPLISLTTNTLQLTTAA